MPHNITIITYQEMLFWTDKRMRYTGTVSETRVSYWPDLTGLEITCFRFSLSVSILVWTPVNRWGHWSKEQSKSTICLVLHVLLFNVGYGPLCYALMAEMLPSQIKTLQMSIVMIFGGIFGFLNLKSFSFLENYLKNGPIYLIYAGVNLIGFIYLQLFLPNTDQLQWILNMMKNKPWNRISHVSDTYIHKICLYGDTFKCNTYYS